MKKLICFIIAGFITLSLTGCARGNNNIGNQNRGANDVRRIALQDNTNTNAGFRDGVYVGYGNEHNNRNERAMVTIQNGKISGIQLTNVAQYDISNETNTGTGANNQMGTATGIRRGAGTPGAAGGTTGANPGGMTGGTIGRTGTAGGPGSAGGMNGGTTGGSTGANLGNNIVGPMTGIAGNAINGLRANLVNLMIQNQRDDVTLTSNDAATTTMVNNWKLAVRRALEQAR